VSWCSSADLTALFRNGFFQSITYGMMLGLLYVVPAALATTTDMGGLGALLGLIALFGAVPAVVAGALTWGVFGARRQPPLSFSWNTVVGCWFIAAGGAYLLVPVWMSFLTRPVPRLDNALWFVDLGFVPTAPIVLPLLFFGTWLWVRWLQPRLVELRPSVTTIGT
jgi:hypothetical protein